MEDTNKVSKVVMLRKNTMLLLKKNSDEWELPGGHLNKNEKFTKAAIREVFEETGIHLNKLRIILKQSDFHLFIAKPKLCKVTLSNEHIDSGWFTKKDIKRLNLTKPTRINLKKILNCL